MADYGFANPPYGLPAHAPLNSHFDETNTHKGAERLCVAGYVFHKDKAEQQAIRWASLVDKWRVPYFHMVDCAHNTGVFGHLTKDAV